MDVDGWKNWTGVERDGEVASLPLPADAVFTVADGPRGSYRRGLYEENDGTIDVRPWYGLRFDVETDRDDAPLALELTLAIPPQTGRRGYPDSTSARVLVRGKGWQTVTVPVTSFDYNRMQGQFLRYVKRITIKGRYGERQDGRVRLRDMRLVRGNVVAVDADVRSKPAESSGDVDYAVTVTNSTAAPQNVVLAIQRHGLEGMPATVSPATMSLQPGETLPATVRVTVPKEIPPGGRERQTLVVSPQGGAEPVTVRFTTLRRLPYPYLVHTAAGWDDVRAKAAKYDWAKVEARKTIEAADKFEVPAVPKGGIPSDQGTQAVYKSYIEGRFFPVAVAWKLTGDKKYAEKAALFLRQLADPANGYPVTLHAVTQGIPQEGGFFETCAAVYDMIHDSGALSDADKRLIEQTFRLYIAWNVDGLGNGGISNWSLFNQCPAAMCALAIQDLELFDTLMNGPGGIVDHVRYGTMDDGWWYEMSLSYNLGCAEVLTKMALAAKPFGIDFLNERIPAAMTKNVGLRPFEFEKIQGMAFGKFGPITRTDVTLKQMWDGITAYPDYRGVMFGMGDGHEHTVGGGPFETAYFAFRDPAYAAVIKQGKKRDLVHGVPDLPEQTPALYKITAKSDNAGIAVLRSQTPGRQPGEQLQAAFKYGTHGGYHGHFDRISFLSLIRHGRSFYNPETSWFGYGSYMYKWWVQVSVSHNMVVVDGKMQEPQECRTLLFHTGPMLQAIAAETTARWSHPPYMGGYDQIEKVKAGDAPYVPIPDDHPKLGDVTDFTEPVRQRRLVVVTDDYVVLADDLKAEREHTFDNLLHLRGARVPEQANVKPTGHAAQFDASPLSSGQFISNVNRYTATAPALVESTHRVGGAQRQTDSYVADPSGKNWETGGAKSLSEPGMLNIDERVLWPAQSEILIGSYAESWRVNKKLSYDVSADGRSLASGTFGAWILGSGSVDVDVTGAKSLKLTTRVARGKDALNTIFWGDARLEMLDGTDVALKDLDVDVMSSTVHVVSQNVVQPPKHGLDYDGGPVTIAGTPMTTATPAEPTDPAQPAVVTINLVNLGAARFKATVGGDWTVGDEEQLRKVVSVRSKGSAARFLTLVEPYEKTRVVTSAVATGPDALRVELSDGRVQELTITGLDTDAGDVKVTIRETKGGQEVRSETAVPSTEAIK